MLVRRSDLPPDVLQDGRVLVANAVAMEACEEGVRCHVLVAGRGKTQCESGGSVPREEEEKVLLLFVLLLRRRRVLLRSSDFSVSTSQTMQSSSSVRQNQILRLSLARRARPSLA